MIRRHLIGLAAVATGFVAPPASADASRADSVTTTQPDDATARTCGAPAAAPVWDRRARGALPARQEPTGRSLMLVGGAALLASQGARRRGR